MSPQSEIGAAHSLRPLLASPRLGHVLGQLKSPGSSSSTASPLQTPSLPPQDLLMEAVSLSEALVMAPDVSSSGQGPVMLPATTPSLHFWSAFACACRNCEVAFAIAR